MAQQKLMTRRRYIDPVPSAEADGFTEVSFRRGSAPATTGRAGMLWKFVTGRKRFPFGMYWPSGRTGPRNY
jgi:hypothetical protein